MKAISTKEASNNLNKLIKEISISHEPIQINGDKINGVLLSEEDWESLQETLKL